ncbi:MAG: hypothetical protein IPH65_10450 [Dehalococcoidia bacterium]|uniref:hypothetical protein n=1 Tax=Candidatus Amarobacter glycogenicus TaxID=3140699 RepID=UPI002A1783CE|nr:hypothetical protein [Dehalococcoidia bacterium]MBK6562887.1 hypothetical protein [Dehalococcoidia bacterium]MBK7126316.1 hypothetical protein [Dehalococcoidia bacterium]MBK8561070.1 hypothetical protein [Dehalococcoidia bacterium]MBK9344438.1 hypothetical protein [Dehalococcoidia bacterium]
MPHQMRDALSHIEVTVSGVVPGAEMLSPEEWAAVFKRRRLLVDFSGVTKWEIPPERLVPHHREIVSRKVRLAAYAPEDWQFGVVRQAWLTAGVPEDEIACVFRDRDEALAWLLRRRASA